MRVGAGAEAGTVCCLHGGLDIFEKPEVRVSHGGPCEVCMGLPGPPESLGASFLRMLHKGREARA